MKTVDYWINVILATYTTASQEDLCDLEMIRDENISADNSRVDSKHRLSKRYSGH